MSQTTKTKAIGCYNLAIGYENPAANLDDHSDIEHGRSNGNENNDRDTPTYSDISFIFNSTDPSSGKFYISHKVTVI